MPLHKVGTLQQQPWFIIGSQLAYCVTATTFFQTFVVSNFFNCHSSEQAIFLEMYNNGMHNRAFSGDSPMKRTTCTLKTSTDSRTSSCFTSAALDMLFQRPLKCTKVLTFHCFQRLSQFWQQVLYYSVFYDLVKSQHSQKL